MKKDVLLSGKTDGKDLLKPGLGLGQFYKYHHRPLRKRKRELFLITGRREKIDMDVCIGFKMCFSASMQTCKFPADGDVPT